MKPLLVNFIAGLTIAMFGCSKSTDSADNQPPQAPSNPSPANGGTAAPGSVTLTWQCSDTEGDEVVYDVYLGPSQTFERVSRLQSARSYTFSTGTTDEFYWQIDAIDEHGAKRSGLLWHFTVAPPALVQVGAFATPGKAQDVAAAGSYCYVADDVAGLLVYNCSDPAHPFLAGSYPLPDGAYRVVLSGTTAHVVGRFDRFRSLALVLLNIQNPSSPQFLGKWDTTLAFSSGPQYLTRSGNYVYATGINGLSIFDVAVPSAPRLAGQLTTVSGVQPDLTVIGGRCFTTRSEYGLIVYNITNPAAPYIDTIYDGYYYEGATQLELSGTRGFLNSGLILDFTVPARPTEVATVLAAWGGTVNRLVATRLYTAAWGEVGVYDVSGVTPVTLAKREVSHANYGLAVSGSSIFICEGWVADPATDSVRILRYP